jgi:anti-sigma factor RsiW
MAEQGPAKVLAQNIMRLRRKRSRLFAAARLVLVRDVPPRLCDARRATRSAACCALNTLISLLAVVATVFFIRSTRAVGGPPMLLATRLVVVKRHPLLRRPSAARSRTYLE